MALQIQREEGVIITPKSSLVYLTPPAKVCDTVSDDRLFNQDSISTKYPF
jgi:hypothetical protein